MEYVGTPRGHPHPHMEHEAILIKRFRPISVLPVIYKCTADAWDCCVKMSYKTYRCFQEQSHLDRSRRRHFLRYDNWWRRAKNGLFFLLDTDVTQKLPIMLHTGSLKKGPTKRKGMPRFRIAALLREWSHVKSTRGSNTELISLPMSRQNPCCRVTQWHWDLHGTYGRVVGLLC